MGCLQGGPVQITFCTHRHKPTLLQRPREFTNPTSFHQLAIFHIPGLGYSTSHILKSEKNIYNYIYIYNSDMILIPADLSTIYVVKSAREVNNHQIKFFVLWFTIFMDCTGIPSLDLQLNMHQLVRQSPNGQCQKNPKKMLGKSTTSFPIPAGSST